MALQAQYYLNRLVELGNNKYIATAVRIISKRIAEGDAGGELHHILPSSLYPEFRLTKENIIRLTHREHFVVHLLLAKGATGKAIVPMKKAAFFLASIMANPTARRFASLRTAVSENMKINNPLFNPAIAAKKSADMRESYTKFSEDDGRNWKTNNPSNNPDKVKEGVQRRYAKFGVYHPNGVKITLEGVKRISDRMRAHNPMKDPETARRASQKSKQTQSSVEFWEEKYFKPLLTNWEEIRDKVKSGIIRTRDDLKAYGIKTDFANSILGRYGTPGT